MEDKKALNISLNLDRLVLWVLISCLAAEGLILFLDVWMNLAEIWYLERFKELSDVAREKSFGTWFSVVQNFMAGMTALVIAAHYKLVSYRKGRFLGWLLVALFFVYISLDDHLVLHERFSGTLGPLFFRWLFGQGIRVPTYEWIFLLGPFFGAFGLFFLIFLFGQLRPRKERLVLVTGLILWVLAVGLDAWDGTSHAYADLVRVTGIKRLYVRHVFMLLEEMLEMVGSTLFLYLFMSKIRSIYTEEETRIKLS